MNATETIVAAFALLSDMAVTPLDGGRYLVQDVAMNGAGNVYSARSAAWYAHHFLVQDGRNSEEPAGLAELYRGSPEYLRSLPRWDSRGRDRWARADAMADSGRE
jgi:hypothetical protein